MISYFVRYSGIAPEEFADFLRYYRERHVPILTRWPGILGITLHVPERHCDPFTTHPDPTTLLVQLTFEDAAKLAAALASPERAQARADFAHFPKHAGVVTHQACEAQSMFHVSR